MVNIKQLVIAGLCVSAFLSFSVGTRAPPGAPDRLRDSFKRYNEHGAIKGASASRRNGWPAMSRLVMLPLDGHRGELTDNLRRALKNFLIGKACLCGGFRKQVLNG